MNNNNFGIQLQLLIDGELEHSERSRFLASVGSESKGWQKIALAFIERQLLDESFNPYSRYSTANNNAPLATVAPTESIVGIVQDNVVNGDVALGKANRFAPKRIQLSWWLATSACLLIGLLIGNWSGGSPSISRTTNDNSIDKNANAETGITHADLIRTIPLSEALERSPAPVPIVFRRELMKQGYLVNELARLAKVQLPTGETIEMPIRQVDIWYLGTATFQ